MDAVNLINLIREFGDLSHDAGVFEREDSWLAKVDAANECFQRIMRHIGKLNVEAVSVPCKFCTDAEENERNYCWHCGRDLRSN